MTDTITTEAEQNTGEHPALGVIEHIDPKSLVLDTNVRDEATLGAQFVASIKEHGVLTPIAAVRDRDGRPAGALRAAPHPGSTGSRTGERTGLCPYRNRR